MRFHGDGTYRYFKPKPSTVLPDPEDPLSQAIPSSTIQAVNKSVKKVIDDAGSTEAGDVSTTPSAHDKRRGNYIHYSARDRAKVGNYAIQQGTAAAIKHFKPQYPALKWSTVNDWRKALIAKTQQDLRQKGQIEPIKELEEKKRGRPSLLSDELTKDLRLYIQSLREAGGVVNTAVVM